MKTKKLTKTEEVKELKAHVKDLEAQLEWHELYVDEMEKLLKYKETWRGICKTIKEKLDPWNWGTGRN